MSCAGKGYGTRPSSDAYLHSQFYVAAPNANTNTNATPSTRKCRKYQSFYPSFTPVLDGLSATSSVAGNTSVVYVFGSNFLPNGTTFVQFGEMGDCPVTYYSSFSLSFSVPLNAVAGNYAVQVVNLYNGNFSPQVNQSYAGNRNYSTSITYTIEG